MTATGRLQGCHVVSLRPVGEHGALRRAAAKHGAHVLALSPWRLVACDDAGTRRALRTALAADAVVFTSPAAVRHAAALQALHARRGQAWLATGSGTQRALQRHGIDAQAPERMDSEGLLALPSLQGIGDRTISLVTAPGGRDRLRAMLVHRGARVLRADVYMRVPVRPSPAALARLRRLRAPPWLAVSSGEALQSLLAQLSPVDTTRLRGAHVVAASARLAALTRSAGFAAAVVARSAMPRDLLDAIACARSARAYVCVRRSRA